MTQKPSISYPASFVLDIFRIIAAWAVLIGHGFSFFTISVFKDQTYFPYIQNIGVDLLIMLCGFFIAHSLSCKLYENKLSFKDFLIEKACRIGLAFVPALILVAVIDKIIISITPPAYTYYGAFNIKTFVGNLLQLQDIPKPAFFITSFGSGRQFWTLAVEWWFYIVAGFLVLYIYPKIKSKSLNLAMFILLVAFSIPSLYHLIGGRGNGLTFTWLLGVFSYLVYTRVKKQKPVVILLILLASVSCTIGCGLYFKEAYCIPFVLSLFLTFLLLLVFAESINGKVKKIAGRGFFKFVAGYTYSLYLVHYSIMYFLSCLLKSNTFAFLDAKNCFFIGIIISNVVAIPFSFVFERNSKKLCVAAKKLLSNLSRQREC